MNSEWEIRERVLSTLEKIAPSVGRRLELDSSAVARERVIFLTGAARETLCFSRVRHWSEFIHRCQSVEMASPKAESGSLYPMIWFALVCAVWQCMAYIRNGHSFAKVLRDGWTSVMALDSAWSWCRARLVWLLCRAWLVVFSRLNLKIRGVRNCKS